MLLGRGRDRSVARLHESRLREQGSVHRSLATSTKGERPLLGLIFLPFATLIYVILWRTGGLSGWDWFWVILAGVLDLAHWGGAWTQRRDAPGYPSSAQV